LLRALALGRKSSSEIQLLLDSDIERSSTKSRVSEQPDAGLLLPTFLPEEKAA